MDSERFRRTNRTTTPTLPYHPKPHSFPSTQILLPRSLLEPTANAFLPPLNFLP
jgi:hypothetical protein